VYSLGITLFELFCCRELGRCERDLGSGAPLLGENERVQLDETSFNATEDERRVVAELIGSGPGSVDGLYARCCHNEAAKRLKLGDLCRALGLESSPPTDADRCD
jgi:hypothetical protein